MAWAVPAAMVASSVIGGVMSNKASGQGSDAQREAMRRSSEISRNQALINSQGMAPYTAAGYAGLQNVFGLSQSGGSSAIPSTSAQFNVPIMETTGNKWDSPTTIGYQGFNQTGTGIDPTGGAGEFIDRLKGYGSNFQFDPTNPAYTQKLRLAQEANDRALAARGMYNSRAGLNLQDETARNVQAEEFEKQYQRGYANLMDLFNMSRTLGATEYSKGMDLIKIGQGAASSAGALGNQATGNVQSAYSGMANVAGMSAANNASLYSGLGAMPMNYLILQNMLGGNRSPSTGIGAIDYNTSLDQNASLFGTNVTY